VRLSVLITRTVPPVNLYVTVPSMATSSAATLGEVAGTLPMLEFACSRCARRGRLRVATLVDRHGRNTPFLDIRHHLAGDCLRLYAPVNERCDIHFPQLRGL
jgi:hypothetical protein